MALGASCIFFFFFFLCFSLLDSSLLLSIIRVYIYIYILSLPGSLTQLQNLSTGFPTRIFNLESLTFTFNRPALPTHPTLGPYGTWLSSSLLPASPGEGRGIREAWILYLVFDDSFARLFRFSLRFLLRMRMWMLSYSYASPILIYHILFLPNPIHVKPEINCNEGPHKLQI